MNDVTALLTQLGIVIAAITGLVSIIQNLILDRHGRARGAQLGVVKDLVNGKNAEGVASAVTIATLKTEGVANARLAELAAANARTATELAAAHSLKIAELQARIDRLVGVVGDGPSPPARAAP